MKHLLLFFCAISLCFSPSLTSAECLGEKKSPSGHHSLLDTVDSLQVSLITCGPGSEAYTLFGHTAIRFFDKLSGNDFVANYGIFSFDEPNFALRFIMGKPDYRLELMPFSYFIKEYQDDQRLVVEQRLNLNSDEKLQLMRALNVNLLPENKVYRYNIFTANCTTKAFDIIRQSLVRKVSTPLPQHIFDANTLTPTANGLQTTYRCQVHLYTRAHPWTKFGIDLLLGANADKPLTESQYVFLPDHFCHFAANVKLGNQADSTKTSHQISPLVEATTVINQPQEIAESQSDVITKLTTPFILLCFSALLIIVISFYGFLRARFSMLLDATLSLVLGLAGCCLLLMVFSEHPTVSLNLQILMLNPLLLASLFAFFGMMFRLKSLSGSPTDYFANKYVKIFYLFLYPICLVAFFACIPLQHYAEGLLPLAAAIFLRIVLIHFSKHHKSSL